MELAGRRMTAWQKWADAGAPDEAALVTHPDDPDVPILLGTNIETTAFKEVAPRAPRATEDHATRMKAHGAELGDMQARSLQQGQSITVLLALSNRELSGVSETLGVRPKLGTSPLTSASLGATGNVGGGRCITPSRGG